MAMGMAACGENGNPGEATETVDGFYTINCGRKKDKIPSSVTAYNYADGSVTAPLDDAFLAANGISLGEGAQQSVIYGSKMYIAMYTSNVVWVVDPVSLKVIRSIQPEGQAVSPRALTAHGGKVYVSMYTGYVCSIDTTTLAIDRTIAVGPNPEQLAVAAGKLYVANSDGMNSGTPNSSVSVVDLTTFVETKIQDTVKILNPTAVKSNGTDVFVVCMGNYSTVPSQVVKISGNTVTTVCEGSFIALNGNRLLVVDAQYGKPVQTFKAYDQSTLREAGDFIRQTDGMDSKVSSCNGVFADAKTGDIVVLSYQLSASSGKAEYGLPMYANIYDSAGNFKQRVECGVGALDVAFIHK